MRGGLLQARLVRGAVLAHRTSFKIGGEASELYLPESAAELWGLCRELRDRGARPHILGGGCNTLFPDEPFTRPVICTERLRGLRRSGDRLRAGAGLRLEALIRAANRESLAGLEHFAGIPGTAGGAVAMNAGGSGHSFGERVERLWGLRISTLEMEEVPGRSVAWDYRTAHLEDLVVTEVELALVPGERASLEERARAFLKLKAARQPLSSASAGCIFRNPPQAPAALFIDRAGLKGAREGAAVVSSRHANFILNEGKRARAADVLRLVARVRDRVEELFGVRLEPEIVIPGAEA